MEVNNPDRHVSFCDSHSPHSFISRQREAELAKLEEENESDDESLPVNADGASTSGSSVGVTPGAAASAGGVGQEAKIIARSFRYMRRKPTIISYKPPEGEDEPLCLVTFFSHIYIVNFFQA